MAAYSYASEDDNDNKSYQFIPLMCKRVSYVQLWVSSNHYNKSINKYLEII